MTTRDVPDGLTALYQLQRFDAHVGVRVLAARTVYGRKELRVAPIGGEGEFWARVGSISELTTAQANG